MHFSWKMRWYKHCISQINTICTKRHIHIREKRNSVEIVNESHITTATAQIWRQPKLSKRLCEPFAVCRGLCEKHTRKISLAIFRHPVFIFRYPQVVIYAKWKSCPQIRGWFSLRKSVMDSSSGRNTGFPDRHSIFRRPSFQSEFSVCLLLLWLRTLFRRLLGCLSDFGRVATSFFSRFNLVRFSVYTFYYFEGVLFYFFWVFRASGFAFMGTCYGWESLKTGKLEELLSIREWLKIWKSESFWR